MPPFYPIFACVDPDPDPYSENRSGSTTLPHTITFKLNRKKHNYQQNEYRYCIGPLIKNRVSYFYDRTKISGQGFQKYKHLFLMKKICSFYLPNMQQSLIKIAKFQNYMKTTTKMIKTPILLFPSLLNHLTQYLLVEYAKLYIHNTLTN